MAAAGAKTRVEGLDELRRALRRLPGDADKALQSHLKDAAEIVAAEARKRATVGSRPIPAGRRPRKRMKDTVVPFVRKAAGGVRVNAVAPGGFRYPGRQEYDPAQGHPFLRPALEAKAADVQRKMEGVLDELADTWKGTR